MKESMFPWAEGESPIAWAVEKIMSGPVGRPVRRGSRPVPTLKTDYINCSSCGKAAQARDMRFKPCSPSSGRLRLTWYCEECYE